MRSSVFRFRISVFASCIAAAVRLISQNDVRRIAQIADDRKAEFGKLFIRRVSAGIENTVRAQLARRFKIVHRVADHHIIARKLAGEIAGGPELTRCVDVVLSDYAVEAVVKPQIVS